MINPLDFTGKVALVTGAATGMGLATAQAFAEAGAAVVLADVNDSAVRSGAEQLVAAGHTALALRCDVSDDAEVAAMVDRTVAEFGRLDAAFNNAGVMARITPIADTSRDEWERVIGINLRGVWSCMKHELRQMERQGSGAIVNNASVGALTGNPGIASYIASKHGVIGLTRTAALEYVKRASASTATVLIAALWPPSLVDGEPATAAEAAAARAQQARTMKIRMDVNGTRVTATLDDNETSRDFISLLPLTLTLEDYNGTEKISNLPKKLSTKDAPAGIDPSVGDITYYSPWGNVAFFYRDFGYSRGLVRLGRLDSRLDAFDRSGPVRVSIQRIDE